MSVRPVRQKVPRRLLLGLGLVGPYIVAGFLYDFIFRGNTAGREWMYTRISMFCGSLVAFVILRTPQLPREDGRADALAPAAALPVIGPRYGWRPDR